MSAFNPIGGHMSAHQRPWMAHFFLIIILKRTETLGNSKYEEVCSWGAFFVSCHYPPLVAKKLPLPQNGSILFDIWSMWTSPHNRFTKFQVWRMWHYPYFWNTKVLVAHSNPGQKTGHPKNKSNPRSFCVRALNTCLLTTLWPEWLKETWCDKLPTQKSCFVENSNYSFIPTIVTSWRARWRSRACKTESEPDFWI